MQYRSTYSENHVEAKNSERKRAAQPRYESFETSRSGKSAKSRYKNSGNLQYRDRESESEYREHQPRRGKTERVQPRDKREEHEYRTPVKRQPSEPKKQEKSKKKEKLKNGDLTGSKFTAGFLETLAARIVMGLLIFFTLFIGTPWAICYWQRWKAEHTIVCGEELRFIGKGTALCGKLIKWFLLSVITLGIYAFIVPLKVKKWTVAHTVFKSAEIEG